jgi:mannose-6-phosphate isomerase-like protein (cupin superfamily)
LEELKMKAQPKSFAMGLLAAVIAICAIAGYARTGAAQESAPKAANKGAGGHMFHMGAVRGPIRAVDLSPLGKDVSSEIVAGPANGLDSAFLIYTRMPAGAHGPKMYTLPVEHTYLVLSGELNVQLGTDKFVVKPDTLVLVHSGVPHEAWNESSSPVTVLEVVTPAPSRDLASLMKPAEPRKIENAAQYVRTPPSIANSTRGVNAQMLTERKSGSPFIQERFDNVKPGNGVGPGLHVHPFDQVYFVLEGTMTLQYGLTTYQVKPNSFIIIPTGVVHHNRNDGPDFERHVTLLLPEPEKEPFDLPVEFKAAPVRPTQ